MGGSAVDPFPYLEESVEVEEADAADVAAVYQYVWSRIDSRLVGPYILLGPLPGGNGFQLPARHEILQSRVISMRDPAGVEQTEIGSAMGAFGQTGAADFSGLRRYGRFAFAQTEIYLAGTTDTETLEPGLIFRPEWHARLVRFSPPAGASGAGTECASMAGGGSRCGSLDADIQRFLNAVTR
jgi:hypothetical protein